LDRIAAVRSVKDLGGVVGALHARIEGSGLLFGMGSQQDALDSSKVIGALYAGGLGLPDRDYYLKDDDKSKETRARDVDHVAKMFALLGSRPTRPRRMPERSCGSRRRSPERR